MARKGGSYIVEKDGSRKLVHCTQPAQKQRQQEAAKPAPVKSEVNTDEIS